MKCISDDEEGDIEAEIQRELDALQDDSLLNVEDVEDDYLQTTTTEAKEDDLPASIQEYLRLLHLRTEGAKDEVEECEIILETLPPGDVIKEDETLLARRIKEELGDEREENPLVLRDQVLSELEEAELREEREKLVAENKNGEENKYALDIIRPGVTEEIQALEEKAQQEMRELEKKRAQKEQERDKWYQERKREEDERREREREARLKRQAEFEAAQKKLLKEQEALQAKLEEEAKEEEKKLKEMEKKFQVEMKAIEEERRIQKEAFVDAQRKEAEYQQKKQETAATKIQRFYRGFRVRKQYQPFLETRRVERVKKRNEELDRIERVEKRLRDEAERKRLEDEQGKKEEEERRTRQEKVEKERKVKEEQRIRQEEKRKREEEKRKRVLEEEKRRKEEEASKMREEEERVREAELKRKLEEENRKKAVEDARKKREEEEKLREAELKRKLGEEKRKAEEEARKKREEEESKRKLEEEKRREEERRTPLEDMKRKELDDKRRENKKKSREEQEMEMEAEKKKMEEESKRLETEEEAKRKAEVNMKEVTHISQVKGDFQEVKDNSVPGLTLTKELEARRLQWVKEHTPWRTISNAEERNHPVAMRSKPSRRIFSASKRLPALTEEQLLKSSPPDTPLFRVKCVILRDAQSCNMESLYNCPELQSLTLHNCGLLTVDGLEKCTEIQELYLENNQIEAINCKGLSKLEEASFANNNLTSIHGLEGCHNVVTLDLSINKITRIGDLSSCNKIQRLFMDNNQLINTKGLSCLTNLQYLSLAHNHLARVYDIDKAMLLQTLNLQANNLQEPPQLTNCVLLRELKLDDNSISSLDSLSTAWLPLLRCLSVSQNSISQLSPLGNLIMLESLDISNNLISDTDSLVAGLQGCSRLKTLKIEGNPVHEDPDCRALVLGQLLCLRWLDGENLSGKGQLLETIQGGFVGLCLNQLQSQEDLVSRHKKETSFEDIHATDPLLVSKRLTLKRQHNRERLELAVRHLLEHENFNRDHFPPLVEEKIRKCEDSKTVAQNMEAPKVMDKEDKAGDKLSGGPQKRRHVAATKIQALWRGWYIRHLIDVNTTKWLAAVSIQSGWRGYLVRSQLKREAKESWDPKRNSAATVIQAHFRGRRVRRRLADALRAAQFYDGEEEEDFDYDEEVDLTAFEFDETVLEQGWTPSETPQLPSRGPVLRMPTQSSKEIPTTRFHEDMLNKTAVPRPRHAWRSADSPITDVNQIDVARTITDHDQMSETSGAQNHLSHRAEELSSEWGFQSSGTAKLMLKRAKKMKYNPARKKKLLDPNKRLALFKKLDETNKLRDVKPPPARRQPPNRIDYFAARQAMANHLTSTSPASEQHNREQMTYSWVYRQAVVHEDEENNIMADQKEFAPDSKTKKTSPQKTNRSPVSLPHMDPVVLSGRTLPLISSALFSQSVEQASSEEPSPRQKSLSSEGHLRFVAIKTHSVPNLLARSTASGDQPIRTEKSNSAGARINRDSRTKR